MLTPSRFSTLLPCILVILASFFPAAAKTSAPDNSMEARAARFFQYREWISACALYGVLLDSSPSDTRFYGRAIVSAGMTADTLRQIQFTDMALKAHVAVDSLFSSVERTSFSVGQTSLYENYLLITRQHEPWLARIIDSYLMRYYTYRRDPDGMIAYSRLMLDGNPESLPLLYTLAQGLLLKGDTAQAIDTYRKIVQLDPRSLEALLYLANYYDQYARSDSAAAGLALTFFKAAANISPTPYISSAVSRLSDLSRHN